MAIRRRLSSSRNPIFLWVQAQISASMESHGTSVSFLFSLVEKFFKSTCSVLDYLLQFVVIISGMAVLAIIDDKTTDLLGLNKESSLFGGYMNFQCLKQILTDVLWKRRPPKKPP